MYEMRKKAVPKRIINWWLTWEDLNWPSVDIGEKIKRRAEQAAKANVTTAILFGAHFRWDYLPYFTLLHDHIATTCEELHKYGIELYDRHSVNLIHRYDTRDEMRHVMLHSGPHIPFSPSREAAATWEYNGKRLNDWRMIDVRDGSVLYYPQYASEGFCYRNPDFIQAYCDYAKKLVADTGIDGLAAEDPVHYMHYKSCACPHCRAELKRRAGVELPSVDDRSFWGNWENPAWREWIDLRYEAGKEFFQKLTPHLPKGFPITTCGSNSASNGVNGSASDASRFIAGGSNYVHMEMSGNTPPYKKDPVTANTQIPERMVGFSHHQAVARENGIRSFSTGYGFSEPSANIIWAVNKVLDTDCCFSTLKARLGLPDHVLRQLPDEPELVKTAYTFEKEHPELFTADQIAQIGVFFSYETRNNSFFGNLSKGYYRDYARTLRALFAAGISAHTVLHIPTDTREYPVIILASVALMTAEEKKTLGEYIANGGIVLVCGPSALEACENQWVLPTQPQIDTPNDFFCTIANGVWHKYAEWTTNTTLNESAEPNEWRAAATQIYYNPHRIGDGKIEESFLALVNRFIRKMPIEIVSSKGYLTTTFQSEDAYIMHFLAADYDTDIDHDLDDIRFHRSRVNFVNKVTPINVAEKIAVRTKLGAEVFTPFNDEKATISHDNDICEIQLPPHTSYAILKFKK
ncbi:MAG: hypothetical protein E7585_02695 [Ruminococcaceae bacterium]|nr:hypothetical protein [Oscillospiraceae bacterium]